MSPDFPKKTVDTLAKRAGYRCSNIDCGVSTVGPNSSSEKATIIGEAAHISGARPSAPRYDGTQTNLARSAITNGIWLCRNCHRKVDADESLYSTELLYAWREKREEITLKELGSESDRIQAEIDDNAIDEFAEYPAIIKRIVRDKPQGWEYRLTAELFQYLTKSSFRKLRDLEDGMYNTVGEHISDDDLLAWLDQRIREMLAMVEPASKLLDRLSSSWGDRGEEGNIEEIHHTCQLLSHWLDQIVAHEERVRSTIVSDEYEECKSVAAGQLGSQALKLASIPKTLNDALEEAIRHEESGSKEPLTISRTINFELPENWQSRVRHIFKRLEQGKPPQPEGGGPFSTIISFIVLALILAFLVF